jgi:glycosyltransferase involved in cell wall biosynthesis
MTAPIRVLMITSDWPDHASWGGTATFIARQVDFLRAAGVDVDVFRFRGGGNPLRYASAWLGVQRRLRRGRYDLVHAQFGQSGLLALPKRLPLVVTFRGDDLEGVLNKTTGRLTARGRVLPLLSRVVARRADATIVVSAHMKNFLHREAQPHVIPSGLDLERFRLIPQAEARRHLGLPSDRRLVLFVGSPTSSRKRYELARQAVEIVQRSLPAELVLGWAVPHHQIPYFMNACDALVFTSLQEGSPNVVKEALACNLPVVSVAIGDVPERLRDLAGCEVSADDRPETIAAALVRALSRGERIAGRERMIELDERVITDRVIGVYRSVLAHENGNGNGNGGSAS